MFKAKCFYRTQKGKLQMRFGMICVLLLFSQSVSRNYYVDVSNGNDSNNGTSVKAAFSSINAAANITNPGDTVYVMDGTYKSDCKNCDVVDINRSGTNDKWIVYKNYPDQKPLIFFTGWNGINFGSDVSYIEINGFTIQGNSKSILLNDALNQPGGCKDPSGIITAEYNGEGICINGRGTQNHPHHIKILNNTIFECPSAGIACDQTDYITVENNTVYNNCWYTLWGTSGIDFYQNWNYDKLAGYHNIIVGNKLFGNRLYVPWNTPCKITDGNGIIIDDSKNTQNGSQIGAYTGRTLIAYNIVVNNGGGGIVVYSSEHVDIVNNTAYLNDQSSEINYGEVSAESANDIKIYNNILYSILNKKVITNLKSSNIDCNSNLYYGGNGADITGNSTITANPLFVNPTIDPKTADFSLKATSPAIGKGIQVTTAFPLYKWTDSQSSQNQIGACPYLLTSSKMKSGSVTKIIKNQNSKIYKNQIILKNKSEKITLSGKRLPENVKNNNNKNTH